MSQRVTGLYDGDDPVMPDIARDDSQPVVFIPNPRRLFSHYYTFRGRMRPDGVISLGTLPVMHRLWPWTWIRWVGYPWLKAKAGG